MRPSAALPSNPSTPSPRTDGRTKRAAGQSPSAPNCCPLRIDAGSVGIAGQRESLVETLRAASGGHGAAVAAGVLTGGLTGRSTTAGAGTGRATAAGGGTALALGGATGEMSPVAATSRLAFASFSGSGAYPAGSLACPSCTA